MNIDLDRLGGGKGGKYCHAIFLKRLGEMIKLPLFVSRFRRYYDSG